MPNQTHDLIVIGAGPGGYVAAIRAAQLGLDVAVVDENQALGGTCLRVGCIPSKAMLESSHQYEHAQHTLAQHGVNVSSVELDLKAMLGRKDKVVKALTTGVSSLFKKNKITSYHGRAAFNEEKSLNLTTGEDQDKTLYAEHLIIATGSKSATLSGVDLSQPLIDRSTEALSYDNPPKQLAVIGGGYIGLEMGSVWRRLGSSVTVIEYLERILPGMDSDLASEAHKQFKKQGLQFELKSRVTGVKCNKQSVTIQRQGQKVVKADRVLVAVGRAPNTEGLGFENLGIETNDRGAIKVDDAYQTTAQGVYAIGDVIPGPMLAHKAEEEAVACVEKIVTGTGHVDYQAIPAVVYTDPEIASVGRTEDQMKDEGIEYTKGEFPFIANGRARALGDTTGKVKVLAHPQTDRVLGVHIIGPRAGDLIAECATAMTFSASSEDIARACHAHPTLSESVKEAALDVDGRAIHM